MTKAVLFDLDDTLFDHRYAARCVLRQLRGEYSTLQQYSQEFLEREDFRLLEEKHVFVLDGSLSLGEARVQRVQSLFALCGEELKPEQARAIAGRRLRIYREFWRAVPGAIALLQALKPHARIAIVTNNLTEEQREKMDVCGMTSLVDELVTSEATGYMKPAAEIFHAAVERLGCGPAEAVMVGDKWDADVVGARNAGIRAVWFNPYRLTKPEALQVLEITSLEPADAVAAQIISPAASGQDLR